MPTAIAMGKLPITPRTNGPDYKCLGGKTEAKSTGSACFFRVLSPNEIGDASRLVTAVNAAADE